jgi:hypothetical protein
VSRAEGVRQPAHGDRVAADSARPIERVVLRLGNLLEKLASSPDEATFGRTLHSE